MVGKEGVNYNYISVFVSRWGFGRTPAIGRVISALY